MVGMPVQAPAQEETDDLDRSLHRRQLHDDQGAYFDINLA
jgi:hypothetical protein